MSTNEPLSTQARSINTNTEDKMVENTTHNVGQFDLSQLQTLLDTGGPVITILLAMSLIAATVFIVKCVQFYWLGISRHKTIQYALEYWHANDASNTLKVLKKTRNPIARVLEMAVTLKSKHADDSIAREETMRIAKRQLASTRSYLKILEVIATLSPLLGLLGTVLGMIVAFQNLQNAGSTIDPALLSGGIWEALLTTASGLIVAIPTVIALNWLEQRVERFKLIMEDTMTQVFTRDAHKQVATNTPEETETPTLHNVAVSN